MCKTARLLLLSATLFAAGCGKNPSEKLASLSEEFVYGYLSASPSAATGAGLHRYQGNKLDEMLDDVGPAALNRQLRFYEKCRQQLAGIKHAFPRLRQNHQVCQAHPVAR